MSDWGVVATESARGLGKMGKNLSLSVLERENHPILVCVVILIPLIPISILSFA